MAGVFAHVNSGECSLSAATTKTLLQLRTATNVRALIHQIRIMGKQAAGGTDTPVKFQLMRNTTAFGTGTGPVTPSKNDPNDGETLQTAGYTNFTVEPTTPTDGGLWWEINPQTGVVEMYAPGQEIKVPGGQSAQIQATSSGTPTILIEMTYQE